MIINKAGHWSWLFFRLTDYEEIINNYKIHTECAEGFMLSRKLFNNYAEVIIIKRTSEKVYKLALYRGSIIEFTSFRKADSVVEYILEQLKLNPFEHYK